MLDRQTIAINMIGGLDNKTDDKMVMPGRMISLENGIFTKAGKLTKRFGYSELGRSLVYGNTTSGSSIASGAYLSALKNELFMTDSKYAYSYYPSQDKWSFKGYAPSVGVKTLDVFRANENALQPSVAVIGSEAVCSFIYNPSAGVYKLRVVSIDLTTNVVVYDRIIASDIQSQTIVATPTTFVIYAYNTVISKLVQYTWNAGVVPNTDLIGGTLTESIMTAPIVDAAFMYIDASSYGTSTYVVWKEAARIGVIKSASANNFSAASYINKNPTTALTVSTNSFNGDLFVAYAGGLARISIFDQNLGVVLVDTALGGSSGTNKHLGVIAKSATTYTVYAEESNSVKSYEVNSSGVVSYSALLASIAGLGSKPFNTNKWLAAFDSLSESDQCCYFLMSNQTNISGVDARLQYGSGFGYLPNKQISNVGTYGSYKYIVPMVISNVISGTNGDFRTYTNIRVVIADYDPLQAITGASTLTSQAMSGGSLKEYDGKSVIENNFYLYPYNVSLAGGNLGSAGMSDGTYFYQIIFEWTDAGGAIHRSAPSTPKSVALALGTSQQKVTITLGTDIFTRKTTFAGDSSIDRSAPIIKVFRTENNGSIYYKTTEQPISGATATIVDSTPDASLSSNEILYTVGGELANFAPPPTSIITKTKNRVFLVDAENPLDVWYSKKSLIGDATSFSDSLIMSVSEEGGPITALGQLDDKLVIFKDSSIYAVNGDGPTATGDNNTFSEPTYITSDVGCIDRKSVVSTPVGLIFKSKKGIYLLTRSLTTEYIGAPVENYNSYTIVGAHVLEDSSQIRFITNSSLTLVYDYYFKQWSVFTVGGVDIHVVGGSYYALQSDGKVRKESAAFMDGTSQIVLRGETAWIKMHGIQGFQRVRRLGFLGNWASGHTMKIYPAYDYASSYESALQFVATSSQDPYQFMAHLPKQKCDAIRFKFEDSQSGPSYGEGYGISDLSIEVGIKRGINKLAASKQVG